MSPFPEGFVGWLIDRRQLLLAVAAVTTVVALPLARGLQLDRTIENMFAADDDLLLPYQELQRQFGGNEVILAVFNDAHLLHPNGKGIVRLAEISRRLEDVAGVESTLSLANIDRVLTHLSPPRATRIFRRRSPRPGTAITGPDNPLALKFLDVFEGFTFGKDRQTAAVLCVLQSPEEATATRRETINGLQRVLEELPAYFAPKMIAGGPFMVVEGFDLIERDGQRMGRSTMLLLAVTIVVCFRSLRWVVIPLAVVAWTVLITRAVLAWSGFELSMISSMLSAIITVTGIATVIHVTLHFRAARSRGLAPQQALLKAGSELAAPILFTGITDAVGFASLLIAEVGPVRDFGFMMACGSLIVLVAVAVLVPGLALLGGRDTDPRYAWGEHRLQGWLRRLVEWTERRPRALAVGLVGLLLASVTGVFRAEVETDFTRNFRAGHPLVESYAFVESRLGGAGVWDVIVPAPREIDDAFVQQMRDFEQQLRAIDVMPPSAALTDPTQSGSGQLTKAVSLIDAIDAAEASYTLALVPVHVREQKLREELPEFVRALKTDPSDGQPSAARIMLRARERQPAAQKLRLIAAVRQAAEQAFPADRSHSGAEVTGPFVLMAHLISSLIRDQWICFALAVGGIGLALTVAFRDLRLALVGLVPNVLPILLVLGGLGWLDLKINMGAAMIAAAAMGLSVDSSIHYLTAFQRACQAGQDVSAAIRSAQATVGPAMVFSTLALVVGFLALCTSQFIPTVYFGLLGSLSLLGGLLGNLIVLPLLLPHTR